MARYSSRYKHSRRRSRRRTRNSRRRFSKRRYSYKPRRKSYSKRRNMRGGQTSPSIHKLSQRISDTISNLRRKLSDSSYGSGKSHPSAYAVYNEGGSIKKAKHFGGYHTSKYLRKVRKH